MSILTILFPACILILTTPDLIKIKLSKRINQWSAFQEYYVSKVNLFYNKNESYDIDPPNINIFLKDVRKLKSKWFNFYNSLLNDIPFKNEPDGSLYINIAIEFNKMNSPTLKSAYDKILSGETIIDDNILSDVRSNAIFYNLVLRKYLKIFKMNHLSFQNVYRSNQKEIANYINNCVAKKPKDEGAVLKMIQIINKKISVSFEAINKALEKKIGMFSERDKKWILKVLKGIKKIIGNLDDEIANNFYTFRDLNNPIKNIEIVGLSKLNLNSNAVFKIDILNLDRFKEHVREKYIKNKCNRSMTSIDVIVKSKADGKKLENEILEYLVVFFKDDFKITKDFIKQLGSIYKRFGKLYFIRKNFDLFSKEGNKVFNKLQKIEKKFKNIFKIK